MSDPGTIAFYDRAGEDFGGLGADGPPGTRLRRFIDALPRGARVLDLGCGAGIATAQLARAGFDVTGLDASEGLLDVARRLAPEARFVLGGFDALDAVDEYDGVWANFSLLHAPREVFPRHLAAIARALRPGAPFHLAMLLAAVAGAERDGRGRAYTYYTAAELRAAVAAAGFVELDAEMREKPGLDGRTDTAFTLLMRLPL